MDSNEYRTQLIVRAYEFAEQSKSANQQCEGWFLAADKGTLELYYHDKLILSVCDRETFLSPEISKNNSIPYFVSSWFY